jgi:hypothetical protein
MPKKEKTERVYSAPKVGDIRSSAKKTTGKGPEYEVFVQGIYKKLLEIQDFPDVKVHQNVEIFGKSGFWHQIDVY